MKHYFFTCLFLFIANILLAQSKNGALTLSAEMKEPSNSTITDFLGEDENAYYVLRDKVKAFSIGGYGYIVESYDKNFKLLKVADIEPVIHGDKALLDHVAWLNNSLYAIIQYDDKKADQTKLFSQQIDKKTMLLKGTPQLLMIMPYDSKAKQANFDYDISRDKKTMAIIAARYDQKDVNESYRVTVFDSTMKQKWQKDITLPYDSKLFEKEDLLLDNQGNIYLRGRLYKEVAKEKRKGESNYSYKVLAYRDDGATKKEYDIALDKNFITDLGFNITDKGLLAVAGFYSAEGTSSIKGIVFMLADPAKGELIKKGNKEFDTKFLSLFDRKTLVKKNEELYKYDLDNIIIRNDGGALLLAEQFWINEVTSTSTTASGQMTVRTNYYYHYNDIISVNINPDLSIAWATKIPKRQSTENDGGYYSSYAYAVVNDHINVVYNDDPDNLKITNPADIAQYSGVKHSAAVMVQISSDGTWKKDLLFKSKEQGEILRPKVCEQSSPDEMFLYAEKGKNYVVGKLAF